MLREPQHERKGINTIKAPPFVLSLVEGLRKSFLEACENSPSCVNLRNSRQSVIKAFKAQEGLFHAVIL